MASMLLSIAGTTTIVVITVTTITTTTTAEPADTTACTRPAPSPTRSRVRTLTSCLTHRARDRTTARPPTCHAVSCPPTTAHTQRPQRRTFTRTSAARTSLPLPRAVAPTSRSRIWRCLRLECDRHLATGVAARAAAWARATRPPPVALLLPASTARAPSATATVAALRLAAAPSTAGPPPTGAARHRPH